MTGRRFLTPSGRFQVVRSGPCLRAIHVPSGMGCGAFSHLAVKTFRQALEGLEAAESSLSENQLALIDAPSDSALARDWPDTRRQSLDMLRACIARQFPNGAWTPIL